MTDKTPPPTVWPTLRAHDARALIRFLVDVVGFEETAVYGEGDVVEHAELNWPEGGGVMLGSAREGQAKVTGPGTVSAYVVTAEPDALCERIRAAGGKITVELDDKDYGSREFGIEDPEGNHWHFGTYRGAPRSS